MNRENIREILISPSSKGSHTINDLYNYKDDTVLPLIQRILDDSSLSTADWIEIFREGITDFSNPTTDIQKAFQRKYDDVMGPTTKLVMENLSTQGSNNQTQPDSPNQQISRGN